RLASLRLVLGGDLQAPRQPKHARRCLAGTAESLTLLQRHPRRHALEAPSCFVRGVRLCLGNGALLVSLLLLLVGFLLHLRYLLLGRFLLPLQSPLHLAEAHSGFFGLLQGIANDKVSDAAGNSESDNQADEQR